MSHTLIDREQAIPLKVWHRRNLITMQDFSKDEILFLLKYAHQFKHKSEPGLLNGFMMASCFFEPSTRTRLSFESAMKRLGGEVIGFAEAASTSLSKKETLSDTMQVIGGYADLIVIRHPLEGAAYLASQATSTPVINAGDGAHQHPTQTLTDLFTIQESQKSLENLHIAVFGDLKYARTARSLVQGCAHFGMRFYFISPKGLEISKELCDELKEKGCLFSFHQSLEEVISRVDILYVTRIQEERMQKIESNADYKISVDDLKKVKSNLKILHPLPRVGEIPCSIDNTPYAHYFQQAQNGLFVRQALLALFLKEF